MQEHSGLIRALAAAISSDGAKNPATVLARALGTEPNAVRLWIFRNSIAWRYRHTIKGMAQRRGISVPDGFTNPREDPNGEKTE